MSSEEKEILGELYNEINHHDIFAFKLGDKSLNEIFSKTKPFEKKFFHYQRYNFRLEDLSPELSFYDIELQDEKNRSMKKEENHKLNNEGRIIHKFNELLQDKKSKISEILENIMEDVNVFDKLSQEENDNKIDITPNKEIYNLENSQSEEEKKNENENLTPIEMIDKIETEYTNILIKKIKSETDRSELYPLDTYKKNNELKVQLLSEQEKNLQFQVLKEIMLIKEQENTIEEKDIFNILTVDKPNQEPGSIEPRHLYIGTNKGKIIKVLLNNRTSSISKEFVEIFESNGECINCIDIFENYMVTGHQDSSIIFWENNKILDRTKNNAQNKDNDIISLKIIKVHQKKKIEIIYSDIMGKVFYLKRIKGLIKSSETKELLFYDIKCPTYKISFFSNEPNLSKSKKKYMIFSLTSSKGVKLLKIRPKPDTKEENPNKYILKIITSPTKKIEGGIFDSTFGYGFTPMDVNLDKNFDSMRGSISESIIVGKGKGESLLLAVSFGEIINLYDIKFSRGNKLYFEPIGHYINDKKIIHISFLANSYIGIISNDYYLKIINTFDFDKYEYKKMHEPTKNSILIYEMIELKNLIMMKQTNIYKYNEEKDSFSNYYIYLNSIATLNKSIIILGRLNLCQYTLLQWDSIIQSFDQEKQYEKMLWLSMVVFNSNKNLLTIQSKSKNDEFLKEYQYQICSPVISKFLIQVVMKEIEKKNFRPLRMLIEFCISAELYECLYESIFPLYQKNYDCYLYQNLTKYILNDDCTFIEFQPNFLISYFKYYDEMHEKIILSEILFHININLLLNNSLILSAIKQYKLINPLIFIQIKTLIAGKIDYFQPIKYMYDLFHEDYIKEKKGTLFDTESEKAVKEEYHKMILENDIKYFNENISTYHEFLAHKILWYCNKCLNKEEFRTNIEMSNNNYKNIAKKIIFFLTRKEVVNEFLEFDSYSYFQIISRFYLEKDLFNLIKREIGNKEDLFEDIKDFVKEYSKGEITSLILSDKYFFYDIQPAVEQCDNFFIKYDFYSMIVLICKENEEFFDKYWIKNAIKFFINFFPELKKSKKEDVFNCHKKWEQLDETKELKKEVKNNINLMIKLFDGNEQIIDEDYLEILSVPNISQFREIKLYLYELSHQYEEYFNLYKEELEENKTPNLDDDIVISKVERIKLFFGWIKDTLLKTSSDKERHKKFKIFLLDNFSYLSDLSLKDLSYLAEDWFKGEEEKIIISLKNSQSQALQFKYINYYFATHECDFETIKEGDTYYEYLLLKINLLIKAGHKEQILNLLHHNVFLCKKNLAVKLLNNKVYDACVFIYYIIDELDIGIKIANEQIQKTLEEIKDEINSENYLSTNIESLLYNFKKYIDLSIGICQKGSSNTKRNSYFLINNYWIIIIDSIYTFQLKFLQDVDENQNNYKTKDYTKINNALDENFELILMKMTDFIPIKDIIDIMIEKCGSAAFKKFKNLNFLMFAGYRINERMLNLTQGLFEIETEKKINKLIYQFNKGIYTLFDNCEFCGKTFEENSIVKTIYFKCGHNFHKICLDNQGYNKYICPKCGNKKININDYRIKDKDFKIPDELFDIDIKKEEKIIMKDKDIKNLEKKMEIQNQIKLRKQNLAKLRRIRKLNQEKKILIETEFFKDK